MNIEELNQEISCARAEAVSAEFRLKLLVAERDAQALAAELQTNPDEDYLAALRLFRLGWRGTYTKSGRFEDWDDWTGIYALTLPDGETVHFDISPSHSGALYELHSAAEYISRHTGLEVNGYEVEALTEINERVIELLEGKVIYGR